MQPNKLTNYFFLFAVLFCRWATYHSWSRGDSRRSCSNTKWTGAYLPRYSAASCYKCVPTRRWTSYCNWIRIHESSK